MFTRQDHPGRFLRLDWDTQVFREIVKSSERDNAECLAVLQRRFRDPADRSIAPRGDQHIAIRRCLLPRNST